MKKTIISILILTMLFGIAGCKNNPDKNSGALSKPDNSSSDEAVTSKPNDNATSKPNNAQNSKPNNSKPANTQSGISTTPTRPEKVTKVYNVNFDFDVNDPIKEVFYDSKNGNSLPYALYIPKDYSASKKYPVILFLHGAGELGNDNQKQLNNIRNMFTYNGDFISQCILICPQTSVWWNLDRQYTGDQGGTLGSALHLLEKIQKTYSCDKNRIYVTGLSMGGYATWDILESYGDIFAAGVPLCGGGNSGNGAAFVDIPIRIYHGTNDPTVSFNNSQNMFNAIKAAGGEKVSLYPLNGVGHDAWNPAYRDRDLFSWMFAQNKASNPSGKYDYIHYFRIVDSNGKTVISDDDLFYTDYTIDWDNDGAVDIDVHLTEDGKNKLNKAYALSGGKAFTVYCATQKVYSFTATKQIKDDTFSISGVFNYENYRNVVDIIQKATD
ncbi:MAG: dienelactone hydrolase family protein [Clostridia bacterium]|nr:dienelactone hydrolase family protein [Clostridia bacterium]